MLPRIMRWVIPLVLLTSLAPARADVWRELAADQQAVQALDRAKSAALRRRSELEEQSQTLAGEIERTKAARAGVRRDSALQRLLAAQKAQSDVLERLATELRGRGSLLAGARRKLLADCDRALAQPLDEARRVELIRLRAQTAAELAGPERPLGVVQTRADPLDGPRELFDKADLLRDSEDKLRREVGRLAVRIEGVERRRHLRERAGALDDDLFGEAMSNRRAARVVLAGTGSSHGTGSDTGSAPGSGAPGSGAPGGNGSPGGSNTPAPPGPGGSSPPSAPKGGDSDGPAPPPGGPAGDTAAVLRNLVDPATLDELRRAGGNNDLELQLRALRRARHELERMADEFDRRARALAARAAELKRRK